jgi:hypothetical protein
VAKRPKSADESAQLPEPFACSAVIAGERVYVAQDMRHDEAQTYADHIGAKAVSGVWVSDSDILQASGSAKAAAALVKRLDKAATKLEGVK